MQPIDNTENAFALILEKRRSQKVSEKTGNGIYIRRELVDAALSEAGQS